MQRLPQRLALGIAVAAMLSACAHSTDAPPATAPDPVIETRVELRTVCPPELLLAVPPREPMPDAAAIDAAEATLAWLSRRFAREALLEARLTDAQKDCPNA